MAQRDSDRTSAGHDDVAWRVGDPPPRLVPQPVPARGPDGELGVDDIWLPPLGPPVEPHEAAGMVGSAAPTAGVPSPLPPPRLPPYVGLDPAAPGVSDPSAPAAPANGSAGEPAGGAASDEPTGEASGPAGEAPPRHMRPRPPEPPAAAGPETPAPETAGGSPAGSTGGGVDPRSRLDAPPLVLGGGSGDPTPPAWTWSAAPPRPDPYAAADDATVVDVPPMPLGPPTAASRSVFAIGPDELDGPPPGAPIDPTEGRYRDGGEAAGSGPGSRRMQLAGAVAAALLLIGGLVAALVLSDGDDGSAGSASADTSEPRPSSTAAPTTTAPPTTTTTAPPTTTTTAPPTTTTTAAPTTTAPPTTTTTAPPPPTQSPVHYRSCWDAWRQGAAPIEQDEPGYRAELDDDGDGVACELDWGDGEDRGGRRR